MRQLSIFAKIGIFCRFFRISGQLGEAHMSKNFSEMFIALMGNNLWSIKAVFSKQQLHDPLKWRSENSIFWNIGQLWPQFSGLRSADIKKLLWNVPKIWSFNSLKIQSVFDLLLWFRRYKHFKLRPILLIFGYILV